MAAPVLPSTASTNNAALDQALPTSHNAPSTTHHGHDDHISSSSSHHGPLHQKGSAALSKLVGRFRSASASESSTPASTNATNSPNASDSDSIHSGQGGGHHRIRTPSFKLRAGHKSHTVPDVSGGTTIAGGRHSGPLSGASISSLAHQARDAPQSLELWSEAYDALRDNPRTGGLVVAYEGIVTQELPEHLKTGGLSNTTLRQYGDARRLELVSAIAESGLKRRRQSKSSQIGDDVRAIVNSSKDSIAALINAYPSAALAWCGLCTLTPLLLDPILRRGDMRAGVLHITGRISWYMHLSRLLLRDSWHDESVFHATRDNTRELLAKLYRKVLEFEMVCVCATASAWNAAAKNVVEWQGLGVLNGTIEALDAELRALVEKRAAGAVRGRLLSDFRDLDVDAEARYNESITSA